MLQNEQSKKQARNWCFTFNYGAPTQPELDEIMDNWWPKLCEKSSYAIAGQEKATTGQHHLQGYVQFEHGVRLGTLKRLPLGITVHWEAAKGSSDDNIAYCTKEDERPLTHGKLKSVGGGGGERQRWERTLKAAQEGDFEKIPADIRIRYARQLDYIYTSSAPKATALAHTRKHVWIYGPTGTGKSRAARQICKDLEFELYIKNQNKWWCGYDPKKHKAVLIDDLEKDGAKCLVHLLKNWLDIYPFRAEIKGGSMEIRPEHIIITSNYHPSEIFKENPVAWLQPILRRVQIAQVAPDGLTLVEEDPEEFQAAATVDTFNM